MRQLSAPGLALVGRMAHAPLTSLAVISWRLVGIVITPESSGCAFDEGNDQADAPRPLGGTSANRVRNRASRLHHATTGAEWRAVRELGDVRRLRGQAPPHLLLQPHGR